LEGRARITPSVSLMVLMFGVFLILVGFILIIMGAISAPSEAMRAEGGGLIMIGPLPIIFHGRLSPLIILIILVVMILAFLLPILHLLRSGRGREMEGDDYD